MAMLEYRITVRHGGTRGAWGVLSIPAWSGTMYSAAWTRRRVPLFALYE